MGRNTHPASSSVNFTNALEPNTFYVAAVANSLAGFDIDDQRADINAQFNSNLDIGSAACLNGSGWDYRLGVNTGSSLNLFDTVLHELAHGLGFLSLIDEVTGAKPAGFDDAYSICLRDKEFSLNWKDMTNNQRVMSSTNTGELFWSCTSGGAENTLLFAPSPYQFGSSVSHWDTSLTPDELMEPLATPTTSDVLTIGAFEDIGWEIASSVQTAEIDLVSSCLAGLGRVDLNIFNNETASSVYRYEFEGLSARQTTVAFEDWGRIRLTGRQPGIYDVNILRDGVTILSEQITINCSSPNPNVSQPEVTVIDACRADNGQVFFQMVNPTNITRGYVIEFDGVRNRSTSAAAFGQSIRGTTGRPDGTYNYLVRTGSTIVDAGLVAVDCD